PFRSLELGVTPATPNGPQDSLHTVSHNGPSSRNNPEFDPREVFSRIFGASEPTDPGDDTAARMARVRKSVLDSVKQDGEALKLRLGYDDRQRVEAHLEAVRAIEKRIDGMD